MTSSLYRGVDEPMHLRWGGRIVSKKQGSFEHAFTADTTLITADNAWATIGSSEINAVFSHQWNSAKPPTSGISTTPHFARAATYATHDGRAGIVYEIDREALAEHRVRQFVVSEFIPRPRVPQDDEVILVTPDSGALPPALVLNVIRVLPNEELKLTASPSSLVE